jgi:hypothetical protein
MPRDSRCFPVFVRGLKSLLTTAFARATAAGHHKLSLPVVLGLNVPSTLSVAIEQRQIAAAHESGSNGIALYNAASDCRPRAIGFYVLT